MKLKNFLVESGYWLGMIAALWFAVHSCAAHAQTSRYWMACAVIHEHGRQCFEEIVSELKIKITDTSGDSIVYARLVGVDSISLTNYIPKKFGWVTDSIKWVVMDTTFEGDCKCEHDWVFGEPNYDVSGSGVSFGCLVDHNGGHCDYYDDMREKICRKCLRSVIEREKWFQHFIAPPKSEFEILKEKQRAKQ